MVLAILGRPDEAREMLAEADVLRNRCRAMYVDLIFGRAHCYLTHLERQLETAQQVADHLFLKHLENGELPFHLVHFGVLSLSSQIERFRHGGSFDKRGFYSRLAELRKLARGYQVYSKMLDRLDAHALYYQGKRSRALEILAGCAHWAETENHPLEAGRIHLALSQMLDEEGLGEHHRRESEREFARAGVVRIVD